MQLSVKNVDERIFKEFKAEAVKEGIVIGKFLNQIMYKAVKEKKTKKKYKGLRNLRLGKRN